MTSRSKLVSRPIALDAWPMKPPRRPGTLTAVRSWLGTVVGDHGRLSNLESPVPAKRTRAKSRGHGITPEAVSAFQTGDWLALERALQLSPWEVSPLDVDSLVQPSPWPTGSGGERSWAQAVELKKLLQASFTKPI